MPAIGFRFIKQDERIIAYGLTEVVFSIEKPLDGSAAAPGNGGHIAFHAGHRKDVHAFYEAGLKNGGKDDGAPGIRSYDAHYYAAFLRDPDDNKIEVVTFSAD